MKFKFKPLYGFFSMCGGGHQIPTLVVVASPKDANYGQLSKPNWYVGHGVNDIILW